MNYLERVTHFLWALVELGFLLLVSIILVYLLLGANSGVFVLSVAQNVLAFANAVPTASFIGMAMVVGLVYIAARRMKRDRGGTRLYREMTDEEIGQKSRSGSTRASPSRRTRSSPR